MSIFLRRFIMSLRAVKKHWLVGMGSAVAVAAAGVSAAKAGFQTKELSFTKAGVPYVKGELLVRAKSTAAIERFAAQNATELGMLVERDSFSDGKDGSGWYKISVADDAAMEDAVSLAKDIDGVELVEPNYIYTTNMGGWMPKPKPTQPPANGGGPNYEPVPALPGTPVSDPDIAKLYGLDKIDAAGAWEMERGQKSVVVADIDTGADYNHKDLINNMWRNTKEIPGDGIDNDNNGFKDDVVGVDFRDKDSRPFDDNQHGSHTAGTIGATGGNGVGISGVAQNASIMVLRFLGGSQGSGTSEDAIKAIDYATKNGAQIMSNSWGGGGFSQALFDAIERASKKDILFVAAAGNSSEDNDSTGTYPVGYKLPNILGVAATDSQDALASFSNYGAKTVHLAAPGVNILSTIPGNRYAAFSGTSMATPHVAGAAVLLKSKYPKLTAVQIKQALMDSVDKVSGLEGKVISGGRMNIAKALKAAANY
jgi:subtilisin family serine protease